MANPMLRYGLRLIKVIVARVSSSHRPNTTARFPRCLKITGRSTLRVGSTCIPLCQWKLRRWVKKAATRLKKTYWITPGLVPSTNASMMPNTRWASIPHANQINRTVMIERPVLMGRLSIAPKVLSAAV